MISSLLVPLVIKYGMYCRYTVFVDVRCKTFTYTVRLYVDLFIFRIERISFHGIVLRKTDLKG